MAARVRKRTTSPVRTLVSTGVTSTAPSTPASTATATVALASPAATVTTTRPAPRAYTRPVASTRATDSSLLEKVSAGSVTGSPSGPLAVTCSGALVPSRSAASGSPASMLATGSARTTTAAKLMTLPERAAMRASPGDTAVTSPPWSTAATSGFMAIQRTGASASTAPSAERTVAVTATVSPASRVILDGSRSMRSGPACTPARSRRTALVVMGKRPLPRCPILR